MLRFVAACLLVPAAFAAEPMPVAQQNELVRQYCAVCHTDAARNGGLSSSTTTRRPQRQAWLR